MINLSDSYPKPAKTYEEQIQLLKSRGLVVESEDFASEVLSKINYYRLSAYTLTLKKDDRFYEGVTFEQLYSLYEFDRKLRLHLLSILEQIEINFRTTIAYHLSHKYGSTPHHDPLNFEDEFFYKEMIRQLNDELDRSKEPFIAHHKEKYNNIFPIWVLIEVASFTLLSKIYSNLKNEDQAVIAEIFLNKLPYIRNWLHGLSVFRNVCAHFGRLYGRMDLFDFKISQKDKESIDSNKTIFCAIFVMNKLLNSPAIFNPFINDLVRLLDEHKNVELSQIGFPENWIEILQSVYT